MEFLLDLLYKVRLFENSSNIFEYTNMKNSQKVGLALRSNRFDVIIP